MRESLAKSPAMSSARSPAESRATGVSPPAERGPVYRDPVIPARPAPAAAEPVGPVEEIAQAYLATTQGDAGIALRCAITDALSDLLEAERRARENSRLISRGYVREGSGRR